MQNKEKTAEKLVTDDTARMKMAVKARGIRDQKKIIGKEKKKIVKER